MISHLNTRKVYSFFSLVMFYIQIKREKKRKKRIDIKINTNTKKDKDSNMINEELRKAHPEQFEEIPTEILKSAPSPLILTPELIAKLNKGIDEAEFDVPLVGNIRVGEHVRNYLYEKVPEFKAILEGTWQGNAQQGTKDNAGRENAQLDRQGQGEQPGDEPEDFMTTQDVRDIIDFMADLSEQGLALPEIAEAVWRDYRIEYHPLKIKRMLRAYYAKPGQDEDDELPQPNPSKGLKVYQDLLSKLSELQKKNDELTAKLTVLEPKPKPESVPVIRKGWIRKIWEWMW